MCFPEQYWRERCTRQNCTSLGSFKRIPNLFTSSLPPEELRSKRSGWPGRDRTSPSRAKRARILRQSSLVLLWTGTFQVGPQQEGWRRGDGPPPGCTMGLHNHRPTPDTVGGWHQDLQQEEAEGLRCRPEYRHRQTSAAIENEFGGRWWWAVLVGHHTAALTEEIKAPTHLGTQDIFKRLFLVIEMCVFILKLF